jgi:DNA-binding NarL/FixJ family response regulator
MGDTRGVAFTLLNLGKLLLSRNDIDRATAATREGLTLAAELGDRELIATGLERAATVAAAHDQRPRALRLLAAADALRERIGVPLAAAERAVTELALGASWTDRASPSLHAVWEAGRRYTIEEAVASALTAEPEADDQAAKPASTRPSAAQQSGLTPREIDVLRLLVEGRSDREIADALFIGHRTVASHVMNILGKLGVESRTAAATQALRRGLI